MPGKFFQIRNIYESRTWNYENKIKRKNISGICEKLVNTSYRNNSILIPICKFWNPHTILFPTLTEVVSANLFLFTRKINICWTLQSTLQKENLNKFDPQTNAPTIIFNFKKNYNKIFSKGCTWGVKSISYFCTVKKKYIYGNSKNIQIYLKKPKLHDLYD